MKDVTVEDEDAFGDWFALSMSDAEARLLGSAHGGGREQMILQQEGQVHTYSASAASWLLSARNALESQRAVMSSCDITRGLCVTVSC